MRPVTSKHHMKGRSITESRCATRKRSSRPSGAHSTAIRVSSAALRSTRRTVRVRGKRTNIHSEHEEDQRPPNAHALHATPGASYPRTHLYSGMTPPQESDSWASDSETLVSEGDVDFAQDDWTSERDTGNRRSVSEYSLRFNVDKYRPIHGGVFAPPIRRSPRESAEPDVKALLHKAIIQTIEEPCSRSVWSHTPILDSIFSGLNSDYYDGSKPPKVFAFALSGHYPVKRMIGSHLSESDLNLLHAMRSAEKHGYRVCLAQLEYSHFGNPSKRCWDASSTLDLNSQSFVDVRAMCGRIKSLRDPDGQRVFTSGSTMLVTEKSVINSDVFWDIPPDEVTFHFDTTQGLGAYYDIERKFSRTAIVVWRASLQGSVILRHIGLETIAQRLTLLDALPTSAISLMEEDLVDPILEDGVLALEENSREWRFIRCKFNGSSRLTSMLHRIASARKLGDLVARIVHAQSPDTN